MQLPRTPSVPIRSASSTASTISPAQATICSRPHQVHLPKGLCPGCIPIRSRSPTWRRSRSAVMKVYGVFIMPGMGFRNNFNATGIAISDEPEGIYYVIDGTHYDSGCCFDYGNSSTNGRAVGTGTMETTYFGTSTAWGRGDGPGPWIMSDMEAGLFSGYGPESRTPPTPQSARGDLW